MALKHIKAASKFIDLNMEHDNDQHENCEVLYKHLKNGLHEIVGVYDPDIPDEDYPDGTIALPINSVFNRIERLEKNQSVYNVKGSTGDPWYNKINHKPWIEIWEHMVKAAGYNNVEKCYVMEKERSCSRDCVGGHMVLNEDEIIPTSKYSGDINGVVYIIPICRSHNAATKEMKLCEDVYAMLLDKYFQQTDYPDPYNE